MSEIFAAKHESDHGAAQTEAEETASERLLASIGAWARPGAEIAVVAGIGFFGGARILRLLPRLSGLERLARGAEKLAKPFISSPLYQSADAGVNRLFSASLARLTENGTKPLFPPWTTFASEPLSPVFTAHADRFQIRMPAYELAGRRISDTALKAEHLLAGARERIVHGQIDSFKDLDHYFSERYLPGIYGLAKYPARLAGEKSDIPYPLPAGKGLTTIEYRSTMLSKHLPYRQRFLDLVDSAGGAHTMTARFDGREYPMVTTTISPAHGRPRWLTPTGSASLIAAHEELEKIFAEMKVSRLLAHSPGKLDWALANAAKIEWISAERWKFYKGGAGTAQLQTRALLEVVGIDSGRYRPGIDPNLEALSTPLPRYIKNYPGFFAEKPHFFPLPQ